MALFETVNRSNVGMVQRGEQLRFTLKPGDSIAIVHESVGQNLERHFTAEFRVARAIDLTHPSGADEGDDFVDAKARTCRDRHLLYFCTEASQLTTTVNGVTLDCCWITLMRNRWPSFATAYCGPKAESFAIVATVNSGVGSASNWPRAVSMAVAIILESDDMKNNSRLSGRHTG